MKNKVKVLETDQFSATDPEIRKMNFKTFKASLLTQGDAKTAKIIGIAHAKIKFVDSGSVPQKGNVWFRSNHGRFRIWKSNYDTSD